MATGASAAEIESGPIPVEAPPKRRLETIDILRGLLMMLMALDHTRDFFSMYGSVDPTSATDSWPALYLTRWVTHLCAPGFVALAGASVCIQRERGKSAATMARFLLTRGLWLIVIEATVITFAWQFRSTPVFFQVIFAIGVSMMALAALQWMRPWIVGCIGVAIIAGHNLLDRFNYQPYGQGHDLWRFINQPGFLTFHGKPFAFLIYPVLPWFGVMCAGYWFGVFAGSRMSARAKQLRAALGGVALLALFAFLRFATPYGDDRPVEQLKPAMRELMSIFSVEKYPPSLDYVLATFGVLLLLYALFDVFVSRNWLPRVRGVVEVFGRVPFFYYVLHIYLIHALALLNGLAHHGDWQSYVGLPRAGVPFGYGLPVVYGVWIFVLAVLYFPCRWFAGVKQRRRDWWLSYL